MQHPDIPRPPAPPPGGFVPGMRVRHRFTGELGTVLAPRPGSTFARVDFDADRREPWEGFSKHLRLVAGEPS